MEKDWQFNYLDSGIWFEMLIQLDCAKNQVRLHACSLWFESVLPNLLQCQSSESLSVFPMTRTADYASTFTPGLS